MLLTQNPQPASETTAPPVLEVQVRGFEVASTPILGPVSLTVAPSETVALVGPSGVGKTSLLRIIAGLEDRFDGTCAVAGRVAMVFQEPTLLPWCSVQENLTVTTGITADQAQTALAEVGLAGRQGDYPHQLSLGQQRRLSLARAFAVKPDLLLMDEPFVSLDPDLVEDMMALFIKLRASQTVATLLVTHVEAEAARLADRIITLGGSPGQITRDVANPR